MAKKQPTIKKLHAVKEAVQELGVEASLATVRQWILDKYNLTLTNAVAQNYISKARKVLRDSKGKPGAPKKVKKALTTPSSNGHLDKGHSDVDAVLTALGVLKGLSNQLGKANVAKLLEAV